MKRNVAKNCTVATSKPKCNSTIIDKSFCICRCTYVQLLVYFFSSYYASAWFSDYKIDVLEVIFSRTNFAQIQIDTRAKAHPSQPISRFYAVYICRASRATIQKTRRSVSFKITQATNQGYVLYRVFHHAHALARRWRGGPIMLQLTARPKATPHSGMCLN